MVSLDKSPYGGQYYITLAASPRALIDMVEPREFQLHFRVRLESLVDSPTELSLVLDLEDVTLALEERRRAIQEALRTRALPLVLSLMSLSGMSEALTSHPRAASFMVRATLRDHLAKAGRDRTR